MLAEVQEYIDAREAAGTAYGAVVRGANEKHAHRYDDNDTWEKWNAETSAADRVRRIATNEAWNGLTASSDPLVRYIAENCKDYQSQAVEVLKALPASLDELDALAAGQDWCEIWNRFRDAAVAKGLFGEVKQPSESRQAMNDWLVNHYGMGHHPRTQLNKLVDAIVAEATATAAEAPASV